MPVIDGCDVWFTDSHTPMTDANVLLKDNGWVRVTKNDIYSWYPPGKIESIERETPGESDD